MAWTFGDLWKRFHLEHPSIDPMLCRAWVLDAYKHACTGRQWGFLRAEGQLLTLASRTITVTVSQGSTAVTSAALFTATDASRQIRFGGIGVPFTISFTDTSNIVLDRAYQGTSGSVSATIFDAYVTLPQDVDSIRSLINPAVYRPMPFFLDSTVIDYWDPNRTATDATARGLYPRRMSTVTGQTDRMLYEWWPYPTSRQAYPFTYYKRPDTLADTDSLVGVFATRAEELLSFARYRAALYPGTAENRNPGYNVSVAREHKDEWEETLTTLSVRDDDQFIQSLEQIDWRWVAAGGLPYDSNLLRQTDASGYNGQIGMGYAY